jgi:hypothetical protein
MRAVFSCLKNILAVLGSPKVSPVAVLCCPQLTEIPSIVPK